MTNGPNTSTEPSKLTRRELLTSAAIGAAIIGVGASVKAFISRKRAIGPFKGSLLGPKAPVGHLLREAARKGPSSERNVGIVIVGGGIAGLSAAWQLDKLGVGDYVLAELESRPEGNSAWGENSVSRYPWGAHYLPLPAPERGPLHELLEDFGVITHWQNGLPVYDEFHLCADPNERVFYKGQWQEGQIPSRALSENERAEITRFTAHVDVLKEKRGADGKFLFAIPVDDSSTDPETRALDRLTMSEYMAREGYESKALHWFVNYGCRDDYGCEMKDVSAWAGLHYFAARRGRGVNGDSHTVLTWPEGNGWLAQKFAAKLGPRLLTKRMAINVETRGSKAIVDLMDVTTGEVERLHADAAIIAAPLFIRTRLDPEWRANPPDFASQFGYSPWIVSNVTLRARPENEVALAWDNVSYHSDSLGYVVADHQALASRPGPTVLTHYWPLSGSDWKEERKRASLVTHEQWSMKVAEDLEHMHPGISATIESIDVWTWGHAMVRPVPGFVWGDARAKARAKHGRVFAAHSDLSGISIFEEAFHNGLRAAKDCVDLIGRRGNLG